MKKNLLYILLFLLIFVSCKEKFHHIKISNIHYRLGLRADSIVKTSKNDIYYTTFPLCFNGNSFNFKSKMYVKDSVFYFKIIEKHLTRFFPLFDLNKKKKYTVNINLISQKDTNIQNRIIVFPLKIIKKKNDNIFIFKVLGILCSDNKKFEAVYFVDYNNGIIGSYLYTNIDGIDYYAYPEGDILKDKIDYSKFIRFQLL